MALASVGDRDAAFLSRTDADEFHHGSSPPHGLPKGPRLRDIVDPYLQIDAIRAKTRAFG